eukprot:CAMPEP_0195257218 /NCGR_PEP_ID=MMETSP0706-20130129/6691_1 /TAXON_ID=33640 /ORGANISM="Asterionellopsis glacialis, Strain CCMP134" /LENGTH=99 /DNA_ID=CAMNT_0040310391 /DNA_START=296 /DNA_END=591 /DNA_ORIENTATION=-
MGSEMSIEGLPVDATQVICSFLGPGHYRYIAGTSRSFRDAYRREFEDNVVTAWGSIVQSVSRLELFLLEDGLTWSEEDRKKYVHCIGTAAAAHGNLEVL